MYDDSSIPDFKGGDETPGPNPSGIVNAEELEGLTLYEKKCVLINREIDNNGEPLIVPRGARFHNSRIDYLSNLKSEVRRCQWGIFLLCSFGYFLDLLWAQAPG